MDLFNVTINMTGGGGPPVNVCELNQIAMLDQVSKMPVQILLLISLGFIALIVYTFVTPYLDEKIHELVRHICIMFSTGTILFGIIFLAATTFKISSDTWVMISHYLTYFSVALVAVVAFIKRKKLLKWFDNVKDKLD
jgi:uncharacterized membrane protein